MKTLFMTHPVKLFTLLMAVVLLGASCKKDKDNNNDSGFPRTVTIEYKVSTGSSLNSADITFTNETGGMHRIENSALPFYKKLDKNLTEPQAIGLAASSEVPGNLKLEIIVNGKSVSAQEFTQSPIISGIVQHTFAK